jgi:hypothetical protein
LIGDAVVSTPATDLFLLAAQLVKFDEAATQRVSQSPPHNMLDHVAVRSGVCENLMNFCAPTAPLMGEPDRSVAVTTRGSNASNANSTEMAEATSSSFEDEDIEELGKLYKRLCEHSLKYLHDRPTRCYKFGDMMYYGPEITYAEMLIMGRNQGKTCPRELCMHNFEDDVVIYPYPKQLLYGCRKERERRYKKSISLGIKIEDQMVLYQGYSNKTTHWPFSESIGFDLVTIFYIQRIEHLGQKDIYVMRMQTTTSEVSYEFKSDLPFLIVPHLETDEITLREVVEVNFSFLHDMGYLTAYGKVGVKIRHKFEANYLEAVKTCELKRPFSKRKPRVVPITYVKFMNWRRHLQRLSLFFGWPRSNAMTLFLNGAQELPPIQKAKGQVMLYDNYRGVCYANNQLILQDEVHKIVTWDRRTGRNTDDRKFAWKVFDTEYVHSLIRIAHVMRDSGYGDYEILEWIYYYWNRDFYQEFNESRMFKTSDYLYRQGEFIERCTRQKEFLTQVRLAGPVRTIGCIDMKWDKSFYCYAPLTKPPIAVMDWKTLYYMHPDEYPVVETMFRNFNRAWGQGFLDGVLSGMMSCMKAVSAFVTPFLGQGINFVKNKLSSFGSMIKDTFKKVKNFIVESLGLSEIVTFTKMLCKLILATLALLCAYIALKSIKLAYDLVKAMFAGFYGTFFEYPEEPDVARGEVTNNSKIGLAMLASLVVGGCVNVRNIQSCLSIANQGRNLFDDIFENLEHVFYWCCAKVTGNNTWLQATFTTTFSTLVHDWNVFEEMNPNWRAGIRTDPALIQEIKTFYDRSIKLNDRMLGSIKNITPVLVGQVSKFVDGMKERMTYVTKCDPRFGNRKSPTVVFLYGEPGQGKSTLVRPIVRAVYEYLQQKHPGTVSPDPWTDLKTWSKSETTDYWDGYGNSFCYSIEELCPSIDPKDRSKQILELLKLVGSEPVPVNMSSVQDKGNFYFTSSMIIITTNFDDFNNTGMTNKDALLRRLHFPIKVTTKKQISLEKPLPLGEIESAWNFEVMNEIKNKNIRFKPKTAVGNISFKWLVRKLAEDIIQNQKQLPTSELVSEIDWNKVDFGSSSSSSSDDGGGAIPPIKKTVRFDKCVKTEKTALKLVMNDEGKIEEIPETVIIDEDCQKLIEELKKMSDREDRAKGQIFTEMLWALGCVHATGLIIDVVVPTFCRYFMGDTPGAMFNRRKNMIMDPICEAHGCFYYGNTKQWYLPEYDEAGASLWDVIERVCRFDKPIIAFPLIWYLEKHVSHDAYATLPEGWQNCDYGFFGQRFIFCDGMVKQTVKPCPWPEYSKICTPKHEDLCRWFIYQIALTKNKTLLFKSGGMCQKQEWTVGGMPIPGFSEKEQMAPAVHYMSGGAYTITLIIGTVAMYHASKSFLSYCCSWLQNEAKGESEPDERKMPRSRKIREKQREARAVYKNSKGQVDLADKMPSFRSLAKHCYKAEIKGKLGAANVYGLVSGFYFVTTLHADFAVGGAESITFISENGAYIGNAVILMKTPLKDRDGVRYLLDKRTLKAFPSLRNHLRSRDSVLPPVKCVRFSREVILRKDKEFNEITYKEAGQAQFKTSKFHIQYDTLDKQFDKELEIREYYKVQGIAGRMGDCGKPFGICVADGHDLLGFHNTTVGADSLVVPLWDDDFPEIGQMDIVTHEQIAYEEVDSVPEIPGLIPVGRLYKSSFAPTETCFQKSLLYDEMDKTGDILVAPAHLTYFRDNNGEIQDPWKNGLKKFGERKKISHFIGQKLAFAHPQKIFSGFGQVRKPIKPFTVEQVCCGEENVVGCLPMDTSTTYEWKVRGVNSRKKLWDPDTKRIDERVLAEVKALEDAAVEGKEIVSYSEACAKDELRDLGRVALGKTRIFFVSSLTFCIWCAMYLKPLFEELKTHLDDVGSAVGTNPHGYEWTALWRRINEVDGGYLAGDCSGFDQSVKFLWTYLYGLWLCFNYGTTPFTRLGKILMAIARTIVGGYIIRAQWIYFSMDMVFSGHYATSNFNSFVTWCVFKTIFLLERPNGTYKWKDHIRLVVYGDDNIGKTSLRAMEWFNMFVLRRGYEVLFGMNLTTPGKDEVREPFIKFDTAFEFLSRHFRYVCHEGRTVFVVAPLKFESTLGMLAWVRKSKLVSPEEQLRINIKTALYEMSLHPPSVYEEFCEKLDLWLRGSHLGGIYIPTYDDFRDRLVESMTSIDIQSGMTINCTYDGVIPSSSDVDGEAAF